MMTLRISCTRVPVPSSASQRPADMLPCGDASASPPSPHCPTLVAVQVVYKVCEDADLEPLLTEVNAIRQKEKDEES